MNLTGEVGTDSDYIVRTPTWVARTLALRDISLGNSHTCAVAHDASVWCWGDNGRWALADSLPLATASAAPVRITSITSGVEQVAGGGWGTAALLSERDVVAWGWGAEIPTLVPGFDDVVAVGNGGGHLCALTREGGVLCWGDNDFGQLGDGTMNPKPLGLDENARAVIGLSESVVDLALGDNASCAIGASRKAYCWGEGEGGLLGNGSVENQSTPVQVVGLERVIALDLDDHACAALDGGALACWGDGNFQPIEKIAVNALTPVMVAGVIGVVDVAVGFWYTCVLTEAQEIYCWGANGKYQLGLGDPPEWVDTPTRVDWRAALP